MDRQRDMVFCHQCENEWYRDEHGLACPRCESDFTEIIEQQHDPRNEQPASSQPLHPGSYPDPDEDDISGIRWTPQQGTTFTYMSPNRAGNSGQTPQGGPMVPPVIGSFASMLGSIMGGRPFPTGADGQQGPRSPSSPYSPGPPSQGQGHSDRPRSAPGSPSLGGVPGMPSSATGSSNRMGGGTYVRSGGGPGFHWSITTSSGPTAQRDVGGQPGFQDPHQDLRPFLSMMFGHPPVHAQGMHSGPYSPGGDPMASMGPFGPLFAGILNPAMMQSGDGVYSQEALDRIISQMMEQNASGNAPGPASAEAITSLPKREITAEDLGTEGKAECSICMDEVNIGQQVTVLPCHHWFHGDCIKAWLGEHDTCPHCRSGIMPKDGPQDSNRARTPGEAPRHDHSWGQGDGSQSNPFVIPESPVRPGARRRHSSIAGPSRRNSNSNNNNDGLFNRMRNAFGGGGQ